MIYIQLKNASGLSLWTYDSRKMRMTHPTDQTADVPVAEDRAVGKLISLLPELSDTLQAGLSGIEPGFGIIGQALHTVCVDAQELTKGINASVGHLNVDSDSSLLNHVGEIVEGALSTLSGCRDSILASQEKIAVCSDDFNGLCSVCKRMRKNSGFLNIIGLNIRVEGSRTRKTAEMFKGFGGEIKTLAAKLGETIAAIDSSAEKVQSDQVAIQSDIADNMKYFDTVTASTRNAVAHATEDVQSISNQAAMTLEAAGTHCANVAGIASEIVMAIQFHDIARQQVEHIISAMQDILDIFNTPLSSPDSVWESNDQKKGGAYSILTLQSAQLCLVHAEACRVYEQIENAFTRISSEVRELIKKVAVSESETRGGTALENGFRSFQAKVENLQQLLVKGDELEQEIRAGMHQASQAVSTLFQYTDQVNNINIELQYKALNAMIMTNKLGEEGSAFEVLSRNVMDLSRESNDQVREVIDIIQSITDASEKASAELVSPIKEGAGSNDFDILVSQCIERIDGAFNQYKQECDQAVLLAKDIMSAIKKTQEKLEFFPLWIQQCQQVLKTLDASINELSSWKDLSMSLPKGARDEIAKRYTMESERRIHEAQMQPDDLFGESLGGAGDESRGDMDDNIELF